MLWESWELEKGREEENVKIEMEKVKKKNKSSNIINNISNNLLNNIKSTFSKER